MWLVTPGTVLLWSLNVSFHLNKPSTGLKLSLDLIESCLSYKNMAANCDGSVKIIQVAQITAGRITILLVWVLGAHDGASAKHHLVLSEGARLIWEDVLDLSQVLCDVQGLTLDAAVRLLIIQVNIVHDEKDLTNLHQLNGNVEGDGNQDLEGKKWRGRGESEGQVIRERKEKEVMRWQEERMEGEDNGGKRGERSWWQKHEMLFCKSAVSRPPAARWSWWRTCKSQTERDCPGDRGCRGPGKGAHWAAPAAIRSDLHVWGQGN